MVTNNFKKCILIIILTYYICRGYCLFIIMPCNMRIGSRNDTSIPSNFEQNKSRIYFADNTIMCTWNSLTTLHCSILLSFGSSFCHYIVCFCCTYIMCYNHDMYIISAMFCTRRVIIYPLHNLSLLNFVFQ